MTMHASRPLYYFLVTIITQFILAIGAMILLVPTGLLASLPLQMLGILMAYNVLVATFVAAIISGQQGQNEESIERGAGLVLGHLVGLVLGGFVGGEYGGPVWAIGGAVICYFVVGWVGSRISLAVGNELDKLSTATYEPQSRIQVRTAKQSPSYLFFYGAVVPLFFMTAAMLVKTSGLPVALSPEVLPTARLVLIGLSLFSIAIPWLRRPEWQKHTHTLSHEPAVPFVGLGLSLAPAIFGFLLFVGFGISLAELSVFSVAASIATAIWGVNAAHRPE